MLFRSDVSPAGHEYARGAADHVAAKFGVERISRATLAQWQAESASRTTYVFDVRSPDEYKAGHLPGMKSIPGGQLIQETERHAATWGARVVLVDTDSVRSVMTAHWMKQMGWDAYALTIDMRNEKLEQGAWKPHVLGLDSPVSTIDAAALQSRMKAGGVSIIDVDWSRDYLAGHIPGAWFALRARLAEVLPQLPSTTVQIGRAHV